MTNDGRILKYKTVTQRFWALNLCHTRLKHRWHNINSFKRFITYRHFREKTTMVPIGLFVLRASVVIMKRDTSVWKEEWVREREKLMVIKLSGYFVLVLVLDTIWMWNDFGFFWRVLFSIPKRYLMAKPPSTFFFSLLCCIWNEMFLFSL